MAKTRMYEGVKTWNPFNGCLFDCVYCRPSFQQQAKRQKRNCTDCYNYLPHEHPERLNKIPNAEIIFVCGNGDISFANRTFTEKIIEAVGSHSKKHPGTTYYFQSKKPSYFRSFIDQFPESAIVLTTLETNRDDGYSQVSKAPFPSIRYGQLLGLSHPRKALTIEPVMDFDLEVFAGMIVDLNPEYAVKTKKSRRILVNHHVESVFAAQPRAIRHNYVFTYKGLPIGSKNIKRSFQTACKNANVPYGQKVENGLTFHDIRRTVKTNMLAAGVEKTYRDLIVGHALPGMDARYLAPSDERLTEAMQTFTEWIDGELKKVNVDQTVDQKHDSVQ